MRRRALAILASTILAAALLAGSLLVFFFVSFPLMAPDVFEACAEPCFGPPEDHSEVIAGTAWGSIPALFVLAVPIAQLAQAGSARPALACADAEPARWRDAGARERRLLGHAIVKCDLLIGATMTAVRERLGAPTGRTDGDRQWSFTMLASGYPRTLTVVFGGGRVSRAWID